MTATSIDVLIRSARLVDGTGNPWFAADLAIGGERILEIAPPGQIPQEAAREIVDATGMVVCPGFIDILSHSHTPLMEDARDLSKITQGVTTEIMISVTQFQAEPSQFYNVGGDQYSIQSHGYLESQSLLFCLVV